MRWVGQTANNLLSKNILSKILALSIFVLVYLFVHFSFLGTNELNPDAVNWHKRSEQFVLAFKTKEFVKTNQHYHPGVTLMWIVGPTVELVKQLSDLGHVYDSSNYLVFHFAAKTTLLFINLLLTLFLIYFLGKIIGFWKSLAVVVLMNVEPFFLGNSRVLHMDVLFSNLVALSLVVSFYAFKSLKLGFFALSGVFAALTVLTRSVGIGIFVYNLAFFIYTALITKNKKTVALSGVFAVAVVVTCVLLFPALWVAPINTIDEIFSRSYKIGVEDGHSQIFLNQITENPGYLFYPVAFLLKVSPFLLVGILLSIIFGVKILARADKRQFLHETFLGKNLLSFTLYLLIFYAGYFLILNTSSKKLDRYILPLFFFFSYAAVWGYYFLLKTFDHIILKGLIVLFFILSIFYPIYKFAPYEFLYYSPIFIRSATANDLISQKNFGMGIWHLRQFIEQRYGCVGTEASYPTNFKPVVYGSTYICPAEYSPVKIGLSDTKAMKELHGNSVTTDTRYSSPSDYEVLVLAVDEEMPEEVIEDAIEYTNDASIFVNDVELWRIYVRDN